MTNDLSHAYFDRQTGAVQFISADDLAAAEDEQRAAQAPDWQQESIEIARRIEADAGDRFVPLPTQFDAHEWEMMHQFALSIEDQAIGEQLLGAIRAPVHFDTSRIPSTG